MEACESVSEIACHGLFSSFPRQGRLLEPTRRQRVEKGKRAKREGGTTEGESR